MVRSDSRSLTPQPRRSIARRTSRLGFKTSAVLLISALVVPAAGAGVAITTLLFGNLPGKLPEKRPALVARPSFVYDAAGRQIAEFRTFDLTVPVQQADIPPVLKEAVVAAEDQRFYDHQGVDVQGVGRAAVENYREGATVQGGSTITQQYIKNAYLTGERTLSRKLREAVLATQLERRMTKDEILFNYLDTVYFGSGAYGIGAAAQSYFGKPVNQLNLSEAALLAGIIPAPTDWSPRVDSVAADKRRRLVLNVMHELDMITESQRDEALNLGVWLETDGPAPAPATLIKPQPTRGASQYPHFVDYVEQLLLAKYGPEKLYKGGLRIETTIVPELQEMAEASVNARLANTAFPVDMSLVSVESQTGFVRAMVGGRDYAQSQVNLATGGATGFQPGSSFKVFVLTAAYEKGIVNPETVYPSPVRFKVPFCEGEEGCYVYNYGGGGGGSQTIRRATWSSTNTVYAAMTLDVGTDAVAEVANRMGVASMDPASSYGISLSLGAYEVTPLEMAGAFATLATSGVRLDPTPIIRVTDETGNVLEDNRNRQGTRVLSTNVAANVTDTLAGVIKSGTGTSAALGRPAAGKTGTADDYSNAWFVGYTPQFSTAVWMGHVDSVQPLNGINGVGQVTGGSHPAIAWGDFMRSAHTNLPVLDFPAPGPLQQQTLDDDREPGTGPANLTPDKVFGNASRNSPPDTSLKAPAQNSPLVTPEDCGGPCTVYGGELPAAVSVPSTTTSAAPTTTAAPARPPAAASPPTTTAPPTTSKQGT
jgi:1A family penicillin-binding protein